MSSNTQAFAKKPTRKFWPFLFSAAAILITYFYLGILIVNLESEADASYFADTLAFLLFPGALGLTLLVLALREKRQSAAHPKWWHYLLAGIGSMFPFMILLIGAWVIFWAIYGILYLATDVNPFGWIFDTTSIIVTLLATALGVVMVRLNWHNLVDQLFPVVGDRTAFSNMSQVGIRWLVQRGVIIVVLFIVAFLVVAILGSETELGSIEDQFYFSAVLLISEIFWLSISAWLWLRESPTPSGLAVAEDAVRRMLAANGYQVMTMPELQAQPQWQDKIEGKFTASIDLVAQKENKSLIIDLATAKEVTSSPTWVNASEFRMASWYLAQEMALPGEVEPHYIFVDVTPDDSLRAFAKSNDIHIRETSNDQLLALLSAEEEIAGTAASWFPPSSTNGAAAGGNV